MKQRAWRARRWIRRFAMAGAATLCIGTTQAGLVGTGTPGSCTQSALQTALDAGGDIAFNCGDSPVTIPIAGLTIFQTPALTLDGKGLITLDGGGANQILGVYGGVGPLPTIALRNLTFANGRNTAGLNAGGAIINTGSLVLDNVTFIGNSAPFGGALVSQRCDGCAAASVIVRNSVFYNNTAFSGGAINVQSDTLIVTETSFLQNTARDGGAIELFGNLDYSVNATIERSLFQANKASNFGGGAISVYPIGANGAATIVNNTFVENRAEGGEGDHPHGGALFLNGRTTLAYNTIAGNTAVVGGGIAIDNAAVTLGNSILSANTGGNCAGTAFTPAGNNLQFGDATCAGIAVQDPMLVPLADNGGATQTVALAAGSPARDAASGDCPATDQRGAARPQNAKCDLGAYEAGADETYLVLQGLFWAFPAGSESGWGVNFAHQGNVVFVTWFTYGPDGSPLWFIALLQRVSGNVYSGQVSLVLGPPFDSDPFPSGVAQEIAVGAMTVSGIDTDNAVMSWNILNMRQTKRITRQAYAAPVPLCTWPSPIDLAAAVNFQDLWWASPAGSQAGWGINFTHQGDVIFATWFTYDANNLPRWFILLLEKTAPNTYSGPVSRVVGSPFSAIPFDTSKVVETVVGNATVTFVNGNQATFTYSVNGVNQTKQITRQVFVAPGTSCAVPVP